MTKISKVASVELLSCDAGWRNYHFVKITTDDGVIGWSEFDVIPSRSFARGNEDLDFRVAFEHAADIADESLKAVDLRPVGGLFGTGLEFG